jgi:Holliday junction resolvase-like predicted endonuclease
MEQSKDSFRELLAFGEEGEKQVAEYLIQKGVHVLPLYQFKATHAPIILNNQTHYISPDLTCFKDSICFFVEVKSKNRWAINRNKNKIETGCDFYHYSNYLELSKKTKIDLFLIFNHVNNEPFEIIDDDSNGMFMVSVNEEGRYWDGLNKKTKERISKPIMFWDYNKLKRL